MGVDSESLTWPTSIYQRVSTEALHFSTSPVSLRPASWCGPHLPAASYCTLLPFPQDSSLSLALTLSCKEALQHSSFFCHNFLLIPYHVFQRPSLYSVSIIILNSRTMVLSSFSFKTLSSNKNFAGKSKITKQKSQSFTDLIMSCTQETCRAIYVL